MDIVSRLKNFMDYRQIAISQFADTCNIPRPTISQILNGRNKKISDEIIGKIHYAFPDLSVVWLMFGEGDMTTNSNIKISEALDANNLAFEEDESPENKTFTTTNSLFTEMSDFYTEKNQANDNSSEININRDNLTNNNRLKPNIADAMHDKIEASKKITNIVVFYADNTFQTFIPS